MSARRGCVETIASVALTAQPERSHWRDWRVVRFGSRSPPARDVFGVRPTNTLRGGGLKRGRRLEHCVGGSKRRDKPTFCAIRW